MAAGTLRRGAKGVVYLSEHPALALIENLANLKGNPSLLPDQYLQLHGNSKLMRR